MIKEMVNVNGTPGIVNLLVHVGLSKKTQAPIFGGRVSGDSLKLKKENKAFRNFIKRNSQQYQGPLH